MELSVIEYSISLIPELIGILDFVSLKKNNMLLQKTQINLFPVVLRSVKPVAYR